MKKISLSLLAAGVMAVGGVAQAAAIYYPDGTVMELGETDTTTLGAGPATLSTATVTTVSPTQYVYVQPNIQWDRSVAMTQLDRNSHLARYGAISEHERKQAAATFNVPARAGEASTMTQGVPNLLTDNNKGSLVVGSYTIPYAVVTTSEPYYVFSY